MPYVIAIALIGEVAFLVVFELPKNYHDTLLAARSHSAFPISTAMVALDGCSDRDLDVIVPPSWPTSFPPQRGCLIVQCSSDRAHAVPFTIQPSAEGSLICTPLRTISPDVWEISNDRDDAPHILVEDELTVISLDGQRLVSQTTPLTVRACISTSSTPKACAKKTIGWSRYGRDHGTYVWVNAWRGEVYVHEFSPRARYEVRAYDFLDHSRA